MVRNYAISLAAAGLLFPAMVLADEVRAPDGTYDFSRIKPLMPISGGGFEAGPFHDFRVKISVSEDRNWRRSGGALMERSMREVSLGLQFGVGDIGFASLGGQLGQGDTRTQPQEFPTDLESTMTLRGFDVMAGVMPLPGVSIGALFGKGASDSSYIFLMDPARTENLSTGNSTRFGGFAGLMVPTANATYSATASLVCSVNGQDYNPGNSPPGNSWSSTAGVIDLGVLYPVTSGFAVKGNVAYTRILDEDVAAGSPPRDDDWVTLKAQALVDLTSQLQLQLGASTWAFNDSFGNTRVSVGLSYRF